MAAFVTFLKDRGVDGASVGRVFHHVLLCEDHLAQFADINTIDEMGNKMLTDFRSVVHSGIV
jgi:hypothetical protein